MSYRISMMWNSIRQQSLPANMQFMRHIHEGTDIFYDSYCTPSPIHLGFEILLDEDLVDSCFLEFRFHFQSLPDNDVELNTWNHLHRHQAMMILPNHGPLSTLIWGSISDVGAAAGTPPPINSTRRHRR